MAEEPRALITFLFTDIEGSTRLWERYPALMPDALARHDTLLTTIIGAHHGRIFKTVGDAFFVVFSDPGDALAAAVAGQQALLAEDWGAGQARAFPGLRVRMALHQGTAEERGGDYFGPTLNRLARVMAAGHGGQVLLSLAAAASVRSRLPAGAALRDLGERRLKDLIGAEQIFQLLAPPLPADFPPLRTLDAHPTNLPAQRTPLVGRDREVATLSTLLRRADARLLTLTGPGGTGKTRLSLQVGADLIDEFEHGVWFVPLASISNPQLVVPAIAAALGRSEERGRAVLDSLQEYLRDKALLLVLDNFEQVLDAAQPITELLDAAPRLKMMVSSREILQVYGEYEFAVPPLTVPDLAHLPPLAELARVTAVALFVQRAQAIRFDFALTAENAPAVAAICARLDGLPLALELAASHVKHLTPQAMLPQLEHRLRLLVRGPRDRPVRQQSLRGAFDWSYEQLAPEEQRLFAHLAALVGEWPLAAAAALSEDAADSVELGLESLVVKSLLRQNPDSTGTARFNMLETIREYAGEHLTASGEEPEVRRRHAAYYLALVEEAEPALTGPQQGIWFARLEADHDNLRAALTWTLAHDEADIGLRLGGGLARFWGWYSYLSEGQRWLEDLLPWAAAARPAQRAKVWQGLGRLRSLAGKYPLARQALDEALALYRTLEDLPNLAWTLNLLSDLAILQNDPLGAQTATEEALRIQQAHGDTLGIARALQSLGQLAYEAGAWARAVSLYEESLALRRQAGSPEGVALVLSLLGDVERVQGNYARALAFYEESLVLYRDLDHRTGIAAALQNLGHTVLQQGDTARAARLFRESLGVLRDLQEDYILAACLAGLGGLCQALGWLQRAAQLFGAVAALLDSLGTKLEPADRAEYECAQVATRLALGDAAWTQAWTAGLTMSPDEVFAYATTDGPE